MVNVKPIQLGKTTRMSFSKINEVIDMPNLIGIQKDSYEWFLQDGIKEVFRDVSPITDANGKYELSFISHRFDDKIKYTIEECKERDATYAVPIRVTARLLNKETGSVIDNEIYMGDLPLMTDSGTFVINGSERVVVSQLVRSPGVYYGLSTTRPVRSCLRRLLSRTAAHGSSTRWTPTTCSMYALIRTERSPLPPSSAPSVFPPMQS